MACWSEPRSRGACRGLAVLVLSALMGPVSPAWAQGRVAGQPAVLASRPPAGDATGPQGWVAWQLAGPLIQAPRVRCGGGGTAELALGSQRERGLSALGVPADEQAEALPQPWLLLRCPASGGAVAMRWLDVRQDGGPAPAGRWDGRDQRLDYRAAPP